MVRPPMEKLPPSQLIQSPGLITFSSRAEAMRNTLKVDPGS